MTSDEWRVIARQILADGVEVTGQRLAFEDAIALAAFHAPLRWQESNSVWDARLITDPWYISRSATCIAIALSQRSEKK